MRHFRSIFLLLFILSIPAFGQGKVNPAQIREAVKFDEFGDLGEREFAPKLKNLRGVLERHQNLQGYLIFYNSLNHNLFRQTDYFHDRKMLSFARYLTGGRGDSPRITFIMGGFRDKMTTELWLVPTGEQPPQPEISAYRPPANLKYQVELLKTEPLYFAAAAIAKQGDPDEEKTEAVIDPKVYDFQEILGETLSKDPEWHGVLIFYADEAEFDVKILRENIVKLLQPKKLAVNRVKIIYGGYRQAPQIESWLVPKNGIEPEALPDEKIEEN